MRNALPKNSTTVRFSWIRTLEWLTPKAVQARAFTAWCTPPRLNPRPPHGARPFELETPLGTLKAYQWGMSDQAPTVLLVHGWGGSAVSMEKLAPPLVALGYQVVAVDLPAHGSSPGVTTNVVELSRAVESALWRLRPTALIAHSLGGAAAGLALTQSPAVQRLVLLAPGEDMAYFAHAFAARAGLSQGVALSLLTKVEELTGLSPSSLSLKLHPPGPQTSVLLVHDPADDEVPFGHSQAVVEHWPHAQLLAAPGVGHHGMARRKPVVDAAVRFICDGSVRGTALLVLRPEGTAA